MQRLELKATHKPVQNYYAALRQFDDLGVTHETAVRSACPNSSASVVGLLAKNLLLYTAANMQNRQEHGKKVLALIPLNLDGFLACRIITQTALD